MKSRRHRNSSNDLMNTDSLMDILTCVVGVMVFMVVFAVLDAQGISFRMFTPMAEAPDSQADRKIFLCRDGTIRLLDVDRALADLLEGAQVSYDAIPEIVRTANRKGISDGSFDYELAYNTYDRGSFNSRTVSMVITERTGVSPETLEELEDPSSRFRNLVADLDPDLEWFAFAVDTASVEVFRKARGIAVEAGFATGWDPTFLEFPYREVVLGGAGRGSGDSPSSILSTSQVGG